MLRQARLVKLRGDSLRIFSDGVAAILRANGILTLDQVASLSEWEVMRLNGIGRKRMLTIRDTLNAVGIDCRA